MEFKIICEKCRRPAEVEKKEESKYMTKTTYKSTCECGGKIKPILD